MANVPQKTIYIRKSDEDLWEWARRKAERERTTVSGVLMNALDEYRRRVEGATPDDRSDDQ